MNSSRSRSLLHFPSLVGFSNKELQDKINRMQLEKRYSELSSTEYDAGKQRTKDILETVGDVAAVGASMAIIGTQIYKIKKGTGH